MKITSAEDIEKLQADINKVFDWASENNMMFNSDKFQVLRYGKNEDLKHNTEYKTQSNVPIVGKQHVKDLGIIMSDDLTFKEHNQANIATARKMIGWITRTFKSRDPITMVVLFKSLVLSRLEYCSVLTSPFRAGEIAEIEGIQRTYTARIDAIKHLNYWDRLKALQMYSLERRLERYQIIYTWKILEGQVPNLHSKITTYWSERHGRKCRIEPVKSRGAIGTIREHSINIRGPRLFNVLPASIRNIAGTTVDIFKRKLDLFLQGVPDQPGCGGYVGLRAAPSNSLVDQTLTSRAWPRAGLGE
ncbi:uncharacterized protein [Procambarus clarkii]|uniref:uncharacterized protein n=1 Tax=Procambarus clarkii TaxID=6728 RepID=UPI003743AA61